MIAIPEAIRIVLQETAKLLVLRAKNNEDVEEVDVSAHDVVALARMLHGRVLARDVRMRAPGYPPYAASIMDGYAIDSSKLKEKEAEVDDLRNMGTEDVGWTHVAAGKVYAGSNSVDDGRAEQSNKASATTNDNILPTAYYITTGAMIPSGCDRVVPVEDVLAASSDQSKIKLKASAMSASNKWIRAPGCDIAAGTTVLSSGSILDHVAIGLVLQSGCSTVLVRRKVTVGVLSTGNELLQHLLPAPDVDTAVPVSGDITTHSITPAIDWWSTLKPGTIPDVNRPVLLSLLASISNVDTVDLGMVGDSVEDAAELEQVLRKSVDSCDVIVTTGGVSRGETDLVERVLVERLRGQLHFGRLFMKPGKPTTFVTVSKSSMPTSATATVPSSPPDCCLVFALPGNPVSAVVGTHLLVRPSLNLLLYGSSVELEKNDTTNTTTTIPTATLVHRIVEQASVHTEIVAELSHDVKLDPERPEYHRVVMVSSVSSNQDRNAVVVTSTGIQQSSRVLSLRDAQGLLVLPQGTDSRPIAKAGERFTLLRLHDYDAPFQLKVQDSRHLKRSKRPKQPLQVGIVLIGPEGPVDATLSSRVESALLGPLGKTGSVSIQSVRVYADLIDRFYNSIVEDAVDILVVVCPKIPGTFRHHIKLASLLRHNLTKVAEAMALLARNGAAQQDATSAIFEVVIGFRPNRTNGGSIVILLPEEGIESALGNIRGLVRHALLIARGQQHPQLMA